MNKSEQFVKNLASTPFTLFSIGLSIALVVWGTLAQVKIGVFESQRQFFNSYWVYGPEIFNFRLPLFPGGLTIGIIWFFNLLASFTARFKYGRKDTGIIITHLGVIILLIGQFFTQALSRESHLSIAEGETRAYIENPREPELAVIMTSDPTSDHLVSIPVNVLNRKKIINTPALPFSIQVNKFYANSQLVNVGARIEAEEIPRTTKDDEINSPSIDVELKEGDKVLGSFLLSLGLDAPQVIICQGKEYHLSIRTGRQYLPFKITLKDFKHEVYPGTDIPKAFSSLVRIENPQKNESRDALIYMNHPLRYGGLAFYQAGYDRNDTVSVLQVVENPAWMSPYISCIVISLGLLIQFTMHLLAFKRRPS